MEDYGFFYYLREAFDAYETANLFDVRDDDLESELTWRGFLNEERIAVTFLVDYVLAHHEEIKELVSDY